MKKIGIIPFILMLLTGTATFAQEMAHLSYFPSFPYGNNPLEFTSMDPMPISQGISFTIKGTLKKKLLLKAKVIQKETWKSDTVPLTVAANGKFVLSYTCKEGPGIYQIDFQAAHPSKPDEFHDMVTTTLFCGLDKRDEARLRFFDGLPYCHNPEEGYTSSDGLFKMKPAPKKVENRIRMQITNKTGKNLLIDVQKKEYGYLKRKIYIPPDNAKGIIDYYYYFKDGPGDYIVTYYLWKDSPDFPDVVASFEYNVPKTMDLRDPKLSLNNEMVKWVKDNIGKKVGGGTCNDLYSEFTKKYSVEVMIVPLSAEEVYYVPPGEKLPQEMVDKFNSSFNFTEQFGQVIPVSEVAPGDIIEMLEASWIEDISTKKDKKWSTKIYAHGAVVYQSVAPGKFMVAHQNINGVPEVILGGWDVNRVTAKQLKYIRLVRGVVPVKE